MMIQITDKANCCGCNACGDACAHQAITFKTDNEGFWYPEVDTAKCVDCGLCEKVCPLQNHPVINRPQQVYSGWSKDEHIRMNSSSGGAFTEIARVILQEGGVVFGCALNNELKAEHAYVETWDELQEKLVGSKYVQSYIGSTYKEAKAFLIAGRKVLFSGTPCQIAGLKNFLRKEYNNLYTVDLLCHGVPSPMIFEEYKQYMEKTMNMKLDDVKFRCKKSSWIFYNMTLKGHVEKTNEIKVFQGGVYKDLFLSGFLKDIYLRPSCYQCHFTTVKRCSDFTVADWWGYTAQKGEAKDYERKGVSLLLLNTHKALTLKDALEANMQLRNRSMDEALKTNKVLVSPNPPSPLRKAFWADYKDQGFEYVAQKYMQPRNMGLAQKLILHMKPSLTRRILLFVIRKSCRLL